MSGVVLAVIALEIMARATVPATQPAIIDKGNPTTLRGEIVDISCYQKKGVAEGTGAGHVSCAQQCARQGKALGLLTEGDGLFQLIGPMTSDNNAKLVSLIGQTVDVTGVQVVVSNSYKVRQSFEIQKVTPARKQK